MSDQICQRIPTNQIKNDQSLKDWLIEQGQEYQLSYLLAHAEDGIIWGRFDQGNLITSDQAFPNLAHLREITLQQCRLFGPLGEVFLWSTDKKWKARLITQSKIQEFRDNNLINIIPEKQILWGTKTEQEKQNFSLVSDGSQGLKHAVPLTNIPFKTDQKNYRPIRLEVNHYYNYDSDGIARIFLSRLVNLNHKGVNL